MLESGIDEKETSGSVFELPQFNFEIYLQFESADADYAADQFIK